MHSLLKRQLERHFGDLSGIPPQWQSFVDGVNHAYLESDANRGLLEHALALFSQAPLDANSANENKQSPPHLLESAVEQSTDAVVITDARLGRRAPRIQFVNPAFTRMTGYAAVEAIGETPLLMRGPLSARAALGRLHHALSQGAPFSGEIVGYRKGGAAFHLEIRVAPIRDSSGSITHFLGVLRDITERIGTQIALRESNEKFQLMAQNITDVFWIRSPDMREVQYVSPGFERIWGRPIESHYTHPQEWTDAVVPQDREPVRVAFDMLTRTSASISIEYRIAVPGGAIRWVHVRGFQVRDSLHKLIRVTGIATDITDRKLTEQALRRSEEYFRFLNDLGEATRALAEPQEIMATMARMLGQRLNASRCAYADVAPDGEQVTILHDYTDGCASTVGTCSLSAFGPQTAAALQSGKTLVVRDVDAEISPADGAQAFNAVGAKAAIICPLMKENCLSALMAVHQNTARDWTPGEVSIVQEVVERCWAAIDRRTTQENLRESNRFAESIAENSTSLIYIIDLETGKNTYANRNMALRLGYSHARIRELGENPMRRLMHPDDLERVDLHFARFSQVPDNRVIDIEYRLRHANGEWRWVWARDTVFERRTDGRGCLVMGTAQDITDRKRGEAQLEVANKLLVEASRQAGMAEIATNVLHNVGNILNSVNVSANLVSSTLRSSRAQGLARAVQLIDEHAGDLGRFLAEDPRGKLLPAYLRQVVQALAQEQQGMIEELGHLTTSIDHIKAVVATQQSYAGRTSLVEPVRICQLAEDALRMNEAVLAQQRVAVVKRFGQVPLMALDRARVLQILINLISNASHAMENTAPESMRLTLSVDAIPDGCLRVSVRDEGEGISPQNLTRIFAHGFTTRKAGHGFGLHSCALAAKQMGGTLTAHSDGPGLGATFILELPIQTVHTET